MGGQTTSMMCQAPKTPRRSFSVFLGIVWLVLPATSWADDRIREILEHLRLSADEAAALEAGLIEEPDDLAARARLVTYYKRQRTHAAREARGPHVLWIIRHHPSSRIAAQPRAR